jgi:hypothetical protein
VVFCPEGLAPGGKVPGQAHNLPHARHARDDVVQPASRGTSLKCSSLLLVICYRKLQGAEDKLGQFLAQGV